MDLDVFIWAVGVVLTVGVPITGWIFNMIFSKLEKQINNHDALESRFESHRLHAAENFATKMEVRDMTDRVLSKLDKIDEKLDKKMDKSHASV